MAQLPGSRLAGRASAGLLAAALASVAAGSACSDPEPPDTTRLQVIAVQAEPPTGSPGALVQLQLVHSAMVLPDSGAGSVSTIDPSGVTIAWFGGCHNPPSGQYYGCLPLLRAVAAELPSPLPDTIPDGAAAEGVFGLGESFALQIPEDILVETKAGPAGVSYAFFAVCRGQLRPQPELEDTVPFGCYDESGQELGREAFAVGFATIHTLPGQDNANPVVSGLRVDDVALERAPCSVDSDCASLGTARLSYRCASDGECWPELPGCSADAPQCEPTRLELIVGPASSEVLPSGSASRPRETLRAEVWSRLCSDRDPKELYPGYGNFALDANFALRAPTSDELPDLQTVPLLAVIRDSRGGTGWLWWSFVLAE